MSQLDTTPMPTEWWLRPVSRQARLGEHSAVVWKLLNRSTDRGQPVDVRRVDVRPVAAEVGEPHVVEHDEHDVGAPRRGIIGAGHHGVDSPTVRPITPWNS